MDLKFNDSSVSNSSFRIRYGKGNDSIDTVDFGDSSGDDYIDLNSDEVQLARFRDSFGYENMSDEEKANFDKNYEAAMEDAKFREKANDLINSGNINTSKYGLYKELESTNDFEKRKVLEFIFLVKYGENPKYDPVSNHYGKLGDDVIDILSYLDSNSNTLDSDTLDYYKHLSIELCGGYPYYNNETNKWDIKFKDFTNRTSSDSNEFVAPVYPYDSSDDTNYGGNVKNDMKDYAKSIYEKHAVQEENNSVKTESSYKKISEMSHDELEEYINNLREGNVIHAEKNKVNDEELGKYTNDN